MGTAFAATKVTPSQRHHSTVAKQVSATKHQFKVLLGQLNHVATLLPTSQTFTCQFINVVWTPQKATHCTYTESRSNIVCLSLFLNDWNSVSFFPHLLHGPMVQSDASGARGRGAFLFIPHKLFQLQWPLMLHSVDIAAKNFPWLPQQLYRELFGQAKM